MWDGGDQPENIQGAWERHAEYFIILTVGTSFLPYGVMTGNWSGGVNIMINLDCKCLQSQASKVSDFVFDLAECY